MKIGIIGSGNIGGTLARLLAGAGHEVVLANSRGPESLAGLVGEIGPAATASTPAGAAEAGDLVVVAIPFFRYTGLPAPELAARSSSTPPTTTPAATGRFPTSRPAAPAPVSCWPPRCRTPRWSRRSTPSTTANSPATVSPSGTPGRRAIPIAGDDAAAKATVAGLIDQIGFDVYDAGSLSDGRRFDPGTPLFNVALTRDEVAAALA